MQWNIWKKFFFYPLLIVSCPKNESNLRMYEMMSSLNFLSNLLSAKLAYSKNFPSNFFFFLPLFVVFFHWLGLWLTLPRRRHHHHQNPCFKSAEHNAALIHSHYSSLWRIFICIICTAKVYNVFYPSRNDLVSVVPLNVNEFKFASIVIKVCVFCATLGFVLPSR